MTLDRRQFAKVAAASAVALAWQQACAQIAETGEVSTDTVLALLDAQGPRGIYEDPHELERLRAAVANMVRVQEALRNFPLDGDEQPLTVFWRG